MSLHISIVAIEGDHLSEMQEFFESCNYRLLAPPLVVGLAEEAAEKLEKRPDDPDQTMKVAYLQDN